jgi:hypothetical protein
MWPFNHKPNIRIAHRDRADVTLDEWRASEALVSKARAILSQPDFRLMLDVLWNVHPGHFGFVQDDAPQHARAARQAIGQGYTVALSNLMALGVHQQNPEPLEADFKPEVLSAEQ